MVACVSNRWHLTWWSFEPSKMKPERLLPAILVIVGAAVFYSVYDGKTAEVPVPEEWAGNAAVRLFYQHDCLKCHTVTALPDARGTLGPGLDDIGNRAAELDPDGDARAYIRQSLLEPGMVVRKGFVDAMPSFKEQLNEQELETLIDWLAQLKTV